MTTLREIFLARRTVLEMCGDRNYNINDFISDLDENSFYRIYMTDKPIELAAVHEYDDNISFFNLTLKNNENNEIIYVSFNNEERLGLKNVKNIIETCRQNNIFKIIILSHSISPSAQKEIEMENNKNFNIEFHKYERMYFNVTKHKLVPKHIILSEQEKIDILKEKKLQEKDLPKIKITNPVIKYYGVPKGTVVKIERYSESAGISFYYRIVE